MTTTRLHYATPEGNTHIGSCDPDMVARHLLAGRFTEQYLCSPHSDMRDARRLGDVLPQLGISRGDFQRPEKEPILFGAAIAVTVTILLSLAFLFGHFGFVFLAGGACGMCRALH